MKENSHIKSIEEHLASFDALPGIEPNAQWNQRVLNHLHDSKRSASKVNTSLLSLIVIFALINGIILFTQLKPNEKPSAQNTNRYKVISQELLINLGSVND